MKKYMILIWAFLLAGVMVTSCNDMLELQNDGRTTMDDVFKTRNGVRGYLNACYNYRPSPGFGRSSLTDDAQDADGAFANSVFSYWYANGFSASMFFATDGQPWGSYYEGIRKCNVFLANMVNVNTETILATEAEITSWIAQAHTLRALYYLQLIRRYGDIPLISEVFGINHDYSGDRRTPVSEVIGHILADCDAALSAPKISDGFGWKVSAGQRGIMTRAVAHAIRSEAITCAVSPLFDDGTYTWADATRINSEALSECLANGYGLFRDEPSPDIAQNVYALYFITRSDEQQAYDRETIYSGPTVAIWQTAGMPTTAGQVTAGPCPTQELVDSYEMQATGEPPVTGYLDQQHLQPVINEASGYDPENPYEGRDPRFYASVYYNGAPRQLGEAGALGRDDHFPLLPDASGNSLSITRRNDGSFHIETTDPDPWLFTSALSEALNAPPGLIYVRMEYRAPQTISNAQFFFGKPGAAAGMSTAENLVFEQADDWTAWELDITDWASRFGWGAAGHRLRFDVGAVSGLTLDVRNMEVVVQTTVASAAPVETYVGAPEGITATDRRTTRTGYYLRKYNNWKSGRDNSADGEVRLFRLAVLYLNFAESACRSDGPDAVIDLGNGLLMSARDAVNAIRNRAGMPPFPAGMTVDAFEKKYRNERRVELAFEEHRYFDVRRWKILEQSEHYVTGMRITRTDTGFSYQRIGFERASGIGKYYFYPLPLPEVNKMQDHTGVNWQNPGWN
ncbi:MAG: RagB/SusD family nutrient uptake outer membrane protein [Bacteroidales bacterium]|nr:RagB/SusD family nutrient uptake outer membrane protein [Bacteroidales bacterium]